MGGFAQKLGLDLSKLPQAFPVMNIKVLLGQILKKMILIFPDLKPVHHSFSFFEKNRRGLSVHGQRSIYTLHSDLTFKTIGIHFVVIVQKGDILSPRLPDSPVSGRAVSLGGFMQNPDILRKIP